ncbi:MAG TPA: UbiA family prenyltransferase [Nitrososphaera sp.]|nr:UbiA family prenyltransferase [Nitrososphaera sp.]
MQDHRVDAVRQYLLLVRLPNVFTAPSNILAGYFAAVPVAEANGPHLAALAISSALLYVAGIVLNDYADIEVDRVERPSRPLPSGAVPKKHALAIAITAIVIANALALTVSTVSLAVSAALTAAIIAYDFKLKRGSAAPFSMAFTRFLNVILGASPVLLSSLTGWAAPVAATLLAAFIVAIMILSKREVGEQRPNVLAAGAIVAAVAASLTGAGLLLHFQFWFLIHLAAFSGVMAITFSQITHAGPQSIQRAIKNMVLSIILLDSVIVAGTAGPAYGLATVLFIVPAVILAKKLYVT